eukprot:TRINITY_DN5093_c1_g1_i1.p1 TRINITY_DN5093_c1_g1~~TRINITY_DN5093_c1_g1_i1.p1  ORF type:complete len:258 (+),score=44.79 TRINITY_DN5093_c1_g1_i1:983-1756(+)
MAASGSEPIPTDAAPLLAALCKDRGVRAGGARAAEYLNDALAGWDIVLLADDSYSMTMRVLPGWGASRWEAARVIATFYERLAGCFGRKIPMHFLNRASIPEADMSDRRIREAMHEPPSGSTWLLPALRKATAGAAGRPRLVVVLTDGEPDDGAEAVAKLVQEQAATQGGRLRFHILPLTDDVRDVGWLEHFAPAGAYGHPNVYVAPDYISHHARTGAGKADWAVRALLTPLSPAFAGADAAQAPAERASECTCALL